jgi:hypothetical protein
VAHVAADAMAGRIAAAFLVAPDVDEVCHLLPKSRASRRCRSGACRSRRRRASTMILRRAFPRSGSPKVGAWKACRA